LADARPSQGLLDTSVVIDLEAIDPTACSLGLPLYTRNPDDLRGLDGLIRVVTV
jgi:hypothetical protein